MPGPPTVGAATTGNAKATVAFTAPTDTGGSPITGYTVTSSPGNLSVNGTASPLTVTGLTNGTTYTFTVRANNSVGAGTPSAASAPVTPTAHALTLYFVHPDHLGTPRVIADSRGQAVWTWNDTEPFGNVAPNQNPSGTGQNFVYNLRFPGQYYDAETGLHYNYYRDYDPTIGRYIESDPIGLKGGINTYAYVGNNPVNAVDPTGQFEVFIRPWWLSPLRWLEPFKLPGPPVGQPKPPGWTQDWEWKCSEARPDAGPRWFDPKGGEWRWGEDQRHAPHWDYNPWDTWNSPWKNLDLDGNELAPGQQLRPPQNSIPPIIFTPDCYATGLCS